MEKKTSLIEDLAQDNLIDRISIFHPLSVQEIHKFIAELGSTWNYLNQEKCLEKKFIFLTYMESIDLVVWLAAVAEQINHHPDIILGYKKMTIRINTHNISAVTYADFVLAAKIERHMKNNSLKT